MVGNLCAQVRRDLSQVEASDHNYSSSSCYGSAFPPLRGSCSLPTFSVLSWRHTNLILDTTPTGSKRRAKGKGMRSHARRPGCLRGFTHPTLKGSEAALTLSGSIGPWTHSTRAAGIRMKRGPCPSLCALTPLGSQTVETSRFQKCG